MSYRTIKHVLGESSLERKCRWLFGMSLAVLMLTSFYLYGRKTTDLVNENTRSNCRFLVASVLLRVHLESYALEGSEDLAQEIAEGSSDVKFEGSFLALDETDSPNVAPPIDQYELADLVKLRDAYQQELRARRATSMAVSPSDSQTAADAKSAQTAPIYETFVDGPPIETDKIRKDEYHYIRAVRWKSKCVFCHLGVYNISVPPAVPKAEVLAASDNKASGTGAAVPVSPTMDVSLMPFRAVKIVLPYKKTRSAVNRINAILLATVIMTVFLSMLALYVVVRYVIVKPLQHLQQVSEQVEQGNYEARAHIETNDEFEQLADAYNRMLRHLVDAQNQLRDANSNLDAKVDQLARANMQLYEMNRMKSDFLASVSHELRTPLNSIIGFSDVLEGINSLDAKQKKYAHNIAKSGRVLLEMINDILDLAKMEAGRMQVRPTDFALNQVVRAQCDLVRSLTDEKNIDLEVIAPDDPLEVWQDQAKIQQILTNLLSNAIKFTPEGGRITVRLDSHGDQRHDRRVFVLVEDTGVGIADEDREIIFEKFRQATAIRGPDNLTREYSGTGLGLSIVKELCKLIQGEISFTSQLGTGSTFRVSFPVKLEIDKASTDALEAAEWTRLAGSPDRPAAADHTNSREPGRDAAGREQLDSAAR